MFPRRQNKFTLIKQKNWKSSRLYAFAILYSLWYRNAKGMLLVEREETHLQSNQLKNLQSCLHKNLREQKPVSWSYFLKCS